MMIGRNRLFFYTLSGVLSTLLVLLGSHRRVDESDVVADPAILLGKNKPDLLLRRSPDASSLESVSRVLLDAPEPTPQPRRRQKPAVAPWTKLMQKDGSTFPRSFFFSEVERLSEYGLVVQDFDKEQRKSVAKQMQTRLCTRSKKFADNKYDANKCNQRLTLLRCATCTEVDGSWYSASSVTGAVFGKVDSNSTVHYPNYNDGPYAYQQIDIGVPIANSDDKLQTFAMHLGESVKKFREGLLGKRIAIRLLITRFRNEAFESEEALEEFRNELVRKAAIDRPGDSIEFVNVEEDTFSRAKAINTLHASACQTKDCVFACTDVDMNIVSDFFRNALLFPFPGTAAYFPIMWSEFNPETVELADNFLTESAQWKYTDHHGYWRKSSYGMYVIAGPDTKWLLMDETFVGWGGEDNDFFKRASSSLNIVRLFEKGLTHVWHPKDCKLGSFVENDFFKSCIGAKAHTEGSQLGLYLRSLRLTDEESFNQIMHVKSTKVESEANAIQETIDDAAEHLSILIAVISSRANLKSRVSTIMKTWGAVGVVPDWVTFKFFVGGAESPAQSGTSADIQQLAREAGINDASMIYVMKDVVDDEYPPVRKNSAMIRHLDEIVTTYENDAVAASTFQWIFKVDDDAYVNFEGLMRLVKTRNPMGYHIYGERGYGREQDREGLALGGLVEPYCTGGPGYVFSRPTLQRAAIGMDACVQEADESKYRGFLWHSDVVIGMCIQKQTGAGCWTDSDYKQNRVFRHNHNSEDPFIADSKLDTMVAMHPFKTETSMVKHHQRYQALHKARTAVKN